VERQAELKNKHEAKWKGHVCEGSGCPEKDSSWKEYDKFRAYLQAANQYGLTGEFKNDTGFGEGFYSQETGVDPFGTAWSDPEEYAWCGSAGNGSFHGIKFSKVMMIVLFIRAPLRRLQEHLMSPENT
jgi:hypothetical protein